MGQGREHFLEDITFISKVYVSQRAWERLVDAKPRLDENGETSRG